MAITVGYTSRGYTDPSMAQIAGHLQTRLSVRHVSVAVLLNEAGVAYAHRIGQDVWSCQVGGLDYRLGPQEDLGAEVVVILTGSSRRLVSPHQTYARRYEARCLP